MKKMMLQMLACATAFLLVAGLVHAGGMDPREMPSAPVVKREAVTVAPEETATAVRRAREAVAPLPAPAPLPAAPVMSTPAPRRSAPAVSGDGWALAVAGGGCESLENVRRQGVDVGAFATPQEFARKMQQRGHQAFVLDIGDTRDQVVRVRVPDLQADFEFKRVGMCR